MVKNKNKIGLKVTKMVVGGGIAIGFLFGIFIGLMFATESGLDNTLKENEKALEAYNTEIEELTGINEGLLTEVLEHKKTITRAWREVKYSTERVRILEAAIERKEKSFLGRLKGAVTRTEQPTFAVERDAGVREYEIAM